MGHVLQVFVLNIFKGISIIYCGIMYPVRSSATKRGRMSSEDGSFMSKGIEGGFVTVYWGAKPKEAKLTTYSNSQVRVLHARFQ